MDEVEDMNLSGPRCQPYSFMGKGKGKGDYRFRFFLIHIKRMVDSKVPVWAIENVEGFPVEAGSCILSARGGIDSFPMLRVASHVPRTRIRFTANASRKTGSHHSNGQVLFAFSLSRGHLQLGW